MKINNWTSWLVLIIGLTVTFLATIYVKSEIDKSKEAEFGFECKNIADKIEVRLHAHSLLLRSGAAFFAGSDSVTREEWKSFVEQNNLDLNLPGILGIGFSLSIPKEKLDEHVQSIRSEGYPEYVVWPENERERYTSIVFLEPFLGRNLQTFGYDMMVEPVFKEAMEQARDMDIASISGKVHLVQENGTDVQAGNLIYVPVYQKGSAINTVEQRRAALKGWVYSSCRMNDLMSGILFGRELEKILRIYDGSIPSSETLLFESHSPEEQNSSKKNQFTLGLPIDFNGHQWTLEFTPTQKNIFIAYLEVWSILVGGLIISLLLFLLTRSLINTQYNAQKIAKKLTVELKESESNLRAVMEASPVPLILTKMNDGVVIIANETFGKLFKISISDTIGQKLPDFFPNKKDKISLLKTVTKDGNVDNIELLLKKSDGELFWCSICLRLLTLNDEQVLITAFHDITEMKNAQEEILKHKAHLEEMVAERTKKLKISEQKLLRSIKDISDYKLALDESSSVTISDSEGIIKYANDKFCELSKFRRDEVIGKTHTILDANFHSEEFFNELWSTVAKGQIWRGEIKNKAKDGSYYWVDTTIIPFLDQNGKPYQNVAVKFDITNRKSIEADLIKAKQAADFANRAKSEFLANMSHEIRTPMNAIIGFSELLTKSELNNKQRSQIESIHSSGKNLLKIINDILDLSKIEAGKIDIIPVPINLGNMLREIDNIFAEKVKDKEIILSIDYEHISNKTILLDEVRCRQILFNLVGNAIKFTHEGRVFLSIEYRENNENKKNIDLTILVKDTGIGIPVDQQEHIFDPFKQPSGQNVYKYGGTGLGLSITKKLVEKMGGSISLKSEVGKGSTFRIDLPNIPVIATNIDVAQKIFDPSTVVFKPATILIADDNDENRKLIIDLLEHSSLTILHAVNGKEAVKMANRYIPDLILMDLRMPVLDGYEATKILRMDKLTKAIPIIAITASNLNSNEKQKENIEKLFDQYLLKPLDIEQFFDTLKKHLNYVEANIRLYPFSIEKTEYELSEELKQKMPGFIDILELEFMPEYKKAIKNQVINEIEEFGLKLLHISEEMDCKILIDYCKEINVYVENFDFEKLLKTLRKFPELVDWLKVEIDSM